MVWQDLEDAAEDLEALEDAVLGAVEEGHK